MVDLKSLSVDVQEGFYEDFYAAYLAALESLNQMLECKYHAVLVDIRQKCQFSNTQVFVIEGRVSSRRARTHALLDLYSDPEVAVSVH